MNFLQPQRGCGSKPKVGAQRLPWGVSVAIYNPNGVVTRAPSGYNPVGVVAFVGTTQDRACLATLGFAAESLWDSLQPERQNQTLLTLT